MSVHQLSEMSDYATLLKDNEDEVKVMLRDLLISITNFFRDPEAFENYKKYLKERNCLLGVK